MSNSPPTEADFKPDQRIGQALVLFCICLTLLLFFGIPIQFFSITIGLPVTLVLCILAPALVFVSSKGLGINRGLRLRMINPVLLCAGMLVGTGGWILAIGIHHLIAQVIGPPLDAANMEMNSTSDYWIMILIGAVMPAICEEALFRGAIQGVLERKGEWFAILVSGILFGLFHLDPWRIAPAAFLGIMFGWLTVRTQSLLPAILAHFANNATAISVAYFHGTLPNWLIPVLVFLFATGVIIVVRSKPDQEISDRAVVNPLSMVSAGVPKLVAWLGGAAIALLSLVIGSLCLFIYSLVTIVTMNDDALLPHVKKGDQLVLIKNGSFAFDMEGGDTVTFMRGDEQITRVVVRVEDEKVILRDKDKSELEISLSQVVGKMVEVIPKQ